MVCPPPNWKTVLLKVLLLGVMLVPAAGAQADEVKATVTITNQGQDLGSKAWWGIYKEGERDHYLKYATSGRPLKIAPGIYDIGIHLDDDVAKHEIWLEKESLQQDFSKTVDLGLQIAKAAVTVTNGGSDIGRKAWWGLYKPGERDSYIAYKYSGQPMTLLQGTYDIGVHYDDEEAEKTIWLENEQITGSYNKTVELGLPIVEARVTITNNGVDVGEQTAWWGLYKPGEREHYIAYRGSGKSMTLAQGTYDIGIHYTNGTIKKTKWLENEQIGSVYQKSVELEQQVATLKVSVTNGGEPVGRKAWWGIYKPGERDSYIAYTHPGESLTLEPGTYDIGVHYEDGASKKTEWHENEQITGRVERTFELGQSESKATVTITNGGVDVGRNAWWGVYPPGERERYRGYKHSGEPMTLAAGTYDIGIHYQDGDAKAERWLENEKLEARYNKTVELALPLANVQITLTNEGKDVAGKGWWGLYEEGERQHYLAYKFSGKKMTIPEGRYDLGIHYAEGPLKVERWLPGFEARGKIEKTIELDAGRAAVLNLRLTRDQKPLKSAWCAAYKTRDSEGYDSWGNNTRPIRVVEGVYDIGCYYSQGGLSMTKWVERQELKGEKTLDIELDLRPASLLVEGGDRSKNRSKAGVSAAETEGAGSGANVSLILDASGSMLAKAEEKKTRMEVAKEVLTDVIDHLPKKDVKVELLVYGTAPKKDNNCTDLKTLAALGVPNPAALKVAIASISASGYTPIAYSLEQAASSLPKGGNNSLVLVTDGIESCNGDPCAVSARLSAAGIVTRSFVVGFGLGADKGAALSCIGRYYPAGDRAELKQALSEVLKESVQVSAPGRVLLYRPGDREKVVARGALDEKIIFPAGTYDVVIIQGGKETTWQAVSIANNAVSPIGEKPQWREAPAADKTR